MAIRKKIQKGKDLSTVGAEMTASDLKKWVRKREREGKMTTIVDGLIFFFFFFNSLFFFFGEAERKEEEQERKKEKPMKNNQQTKKENRARRNRIESFAQGLVQS